MLMAVAYPDGSETYYKLEHAAPMVQFDLPRIGSRHYQVGLFQSRSEVDGFLSIVH